MGREIPVVCPVQTCMMPYSLRSVEFGRVRRKIEYLYVFPIVREPCPCTSVLVIGGIVLNQEYFPREVAVHDSFEIRNVSLGVEHRLEIIKETGAIQLYGAENLEGVPLASGRYFWLGSYARPCAVECRVLSETRLVFEENDRPFVFGFFLRPQIPDSPQSSIQLYVMLRPPPYFHLCTCRSCPANLATGVHQPTLISPTPRSTHNTRHTDSGTRSQIR